MSSTDATPPTKRPWTTEEDEQIAQLVAELGTKSWSVVASRLYCRTGKQCRERWHNQLDPAINKGEWTPEEDQILLETHAKVGSKWAEIATYLPGRTDNALKNRWNSALRRQLRKLNTATPVPAEEGKPKPVPLRETLTAAAATFNSTDANGSQPEPQAPPKGSTDANQRRLIKHVQSLNDVWEKTATEATPEDAKALGNEVNTLQDFCRDLVRDSLRRQQEEALTAPAAPTRKRSRSKKQQATEDPQASEAKRPRVEGSEDLFASALGAHGEPMEVLPPSFVDLLSPSKLSFDVDELLALVGNTSNVGDLLQSPRGSPLVALSPRVSPALETGLGLDSSDSESDYSQAETEIVDQIEMAGVGLRRRPAGATNLHLLNLMQTPSSVPSSAGSLSTVGLSEEEQDCLPDSDSLADFILQSNAGLTRCNSMSGSPGLLSPSWLGSLLVAA